MVSLGHKALTFIYLLDVTPDDASFFQDQKKLATMWMCVPKHLHLRILNVGRSLPIHKKRAVSTLIMKTQQLQTKQEDDKFLMLL